LPLLAVSFKYGFVASPGIRALSGPSPGHWVFRQSLALAPAGFGVGVGLEGAEISAGFLLADPLEKGLEWRGGAERVEGVVEFGQVVVRKQRVELFVTGFAKGRAVLGFAAFFTGLEVVSGDQVRGDLAAAEGAEQRRGLR
jgi:hypothetical protein